MSPAGCTAEVEANNDTVEWLRRGRRPDGCALNAKRAPVGFRDVKWIRQGLPGAPVDNKQYGEARKALMQQMAKRQQEDARSRKNSRKK